MRFRTGEFYMHKNSMDICFKVVNVLAQTEDTAKLIVEYWNLGYTGRPWLINDDQFLINITKGFKQDWTQLDTWAMTNARMESGIPKGTKI